MEIQSEAPSLVPRRAPPSLLKDKAAAQQTISKRTEFASAAEEGASQEAFLEGRVESGTGSWRYDCFQRSSHDHLSV